MALPARRVDLEVGSPEWARRTLDYCKRLWASTENSRDRWLAAVEELREGRAWEPLGKADLDELLVAEIGVTVGDSHAILRARGRPQKNQEKPVNNRIVYGSTNRAYLLARLARDGHSDLLEQVARHELSAHAAAVRAGYSKRTVSVPIDDLDGLARTLKRLLGDRLPELLRALTT